MRITPHLFEAFLKCETKCWLRAAGEQGAGNTYADWFQTQGESYRVAQLERLRAEIPPNDCAISPSTKEVKAGKWQVAVEVEVQSNYVLSRTNNEDSLNSSVKEAEEEPQDEFIVESCLHAVERVPADARGKAAQFIPIRFVFTNKLGKNDKLLLAFDAYALSKSLRRTIELGKIIHGDERTVRKVKIPTLAAEVRRCLTKIAGILSSSSPPDLVLNRHCAECEFQGRCHKIAVEKDDLSLIRNLSQKQIGKLNAKGIFTVNQLSFTFNPMMVARKGFKNNPKHFCSLKALAIRDAKVYVVDGFDVPVAETNIYLDVEGIPDRDFYYLIGMVVSNGTTSEYEFFWAKDDADEINMWHAFLNRICSFNDFLINHFGSYDARFIERMCKKYDVEDSIIQRLRDSTVNVLTIIYNHVYFPTYGNGLKSIENYLGFTRSSKVESGLQSIVNRAEWDQLHEEKIKQELISYNRDDCESLKVVLDTIRMYLDESSPSESIVHANSISKTNRGLFKKVDFCDEDYEKINNRAYFDYQRSKVYFRTELSVRRSNHRVPRISIKKRLDKLKINQEVVCKRPSRCIFCGKGWPHKSMPIVRKIYDLRITNGGIKRWIVQYKSGYYHCKNKKCKKVFSSPSFSSVPHKFGNVLCGYITYLSIHQSMPLRSIASQLDELFDYPISHGSILNIKRNSTRRYMHLYDGLLDGLVSGNVIHADETPVRTRNGTGYIWVLTNFESVFYFFTETRKGEKIKELLERFRGVLVSDFYAVYDSFSCHQQKCHIHLIRDINDDLKKNPFDDELKSISDGYRDMLTPIIDTIDRYGLKKYHLNKHRKQVMRFYKKYVDVNYASSCAEALRKRFDKNRDKLFTFLEYDGIPWNNNNAEHAVKPVVKGRLKRSGLTTPSSINEFLVLLSICQSLRLRNLSVFDFFVSGMINETVFLDDCL